MNRYRPTTYSVSTVLVLIVFMSVPWRSGAETDLEASKAFGVLAREQSLAEGYVTMLNDFGRQDAGSYAEGIRLYASAKAEFDGLIARMSHDIIRRRPFDGSEQFQAVLERAVERRLDFTRHVDAILDARGTSDTRSVKDYIRLPAELIAAIKDAAGAIWDKYWEIRDTRRQEILDQLEALKWKPFHELGRSN
ncbi:hypothetical protein [Candidatus Thiosymbion oneisti]|uniref:hypothetical protein n=1 Tax=Candidatus Thiosymbion oneisti TaxID=589554 RepID=UPI000B7E1301|nr:hypothetical protein [Candidatus Thiosymbion oneisti]